MRHKKILDTDVAVETTTTDEPTAQKSETQQSRRNHDVSIAFGLYTGADMPESLTPKESAAKDQIFGDEIDPAWKDNES